MGAMRLRWVVGLVGWLLVVWACAAGPWWTYLVVASIASLLLCVSFVRSTFPTTEPNEDDLPRCQHDPSVVVVSCLLTRATAEEMGAQWEEIGPHHFHDRICPYCLGAGCRFCPNDLRRCQYCGAVKPRGQMYIYDDAYEYQCDASHSCYSVFNESFEGWKRVPPA